LIHRARLREIGGLGSSACVGKGRQQIILNDRPQQDVGAELFWGRTDAANQFGWRKLFCRRVGADYEFRSGSITAAVNGCTRSLSQGEKQNRRRGDFHLLVIAGRFQSLAARQQRGGEFVGTLDS